MRIGNYEIKKDRNSYILTTYGISDKPLKINGKPNLNYGQEIKIDEIYPTTLSSAITRMRNFLVKDKAVDESECCSELIEKIEALDKIFLEKLQAFNDKEIGK